MNVVNELWPLSDLFSRLPAQKVQCIIESVKLVDPHHSLHCHSIHNSQNHLKVYIVRIYIHSMVAPFHLQLPACRHRRDRTINLAAFVGSSANRVIHSGIYVVCI